MSSKVLQVPAHDTLGTVAVRATAIAAAKRGGLARGRLAVAPRVALAIFPEVYSQADLREQFRDSYRKSFHAYPKVGGSAPGLQTMFRTTLPAAQSLTVLVTW